MLAHESCEACHLDQTMHPCNVAKATPSALQSSLVQVGTLSHHHHNALRSAPASASAACLKDHWIISGLSVELVDDTSCASVSNSLIPSVAKTAVALAAAATVLSRRAGQVAWSQVGTPPLAVPAAVNPLWPLQTAAKGSQAMCCQHGRPPI